ncbi:MAG: DUF1080 domain-containing protein [Candidatus Omnitrophota bacterium]
MKKGAGLILFFSVLTLAMANATASENNDGWIGLFNGENLDGWKAVENPSSISVRDGMIVGDGPRAHLFYIGPVANLDFKNFIFRAEVLTVTGTNSGVFFHTKYEESSSPSQGYEAQINNSMPREKVKTGSLYQVKNLYETSVKDNQWFTLEIMVQGKRIVVKVDDKTLMDFTEPPDHMPPKSHPGRFLSSGTFALQNHDPKSRVYFRNIRVKILPD